MSRPTGWCVALVLAAGAGVTAPIGAQNAVGVAGVLSNQDSNTLRQRNAFGLGVSYTYDALGFSLLGRPARVKVLGAIDFEILNGERRPGKCLDPNSITQETHFYSNRGTDEFVDPRTAEAPPPTKLFGGLFAVVDVWRFRVGFSPITGHFGENDESTSWMVGFAMTPVSWIMLELPEHGGFRLRIEGSIWADPLSTF